MRYERTLAGIVWRLAVVMVGCQPQTHPGAVPPSPAEAPGTSPNAGPARAKQPITGFNLHLNGFHVMKDDPSHFMEAQHYCKQVSADRTECVLFDGIGEKARMNGVEASVSETLVAKLPAAERKYWQPHKYEILSGQLVLPALTSVAEKATVTLMMNTYGKTWHFPDVPAGGDAAPMGPPVLAWSINADGELPEGMLDERNRRFHISTSEKRTERADLTFKAHPQEGVDALAGAFPNRRPVAGVAGKATEDAQGSGH